MAVMDIQPYAPDSYSTQQYPNSYSYAYGYEADPHKQQQKTVKKATSGPKAWKLSDPEMKRKRRVASYKYLAVEASVKNSVKKSIRWLKGKCFDMQYRWW